MLTAPDPPPSAACPAVVSRCLLRRCQGVNPFYQYVHTAWMITGILFYFHQISLLRFISGSQLVVWYYRTMGAKIGKGVLLNSLSRWVQGRNAGPEMLVPSGSIARQTQHC